MDISLSPCRGRSVRVKGGWACTYFIATPRQGIPSPTLARTNRAMSYCGYTPEPTLKPPPCTKTKTGRSLPPYLTTLPPCPEAGAVIFKLKPFVSDIESALRSYSSACWMRRCSPSGPGAIERTWGLCGRRSMSMSLCICRIDKGLQGSPESGGVGRCILRVRLHHRWSEAVGESRILQA